MLPGVNDSGLPEGASEPPASPPPLRGRRLARELLGLGQLGRLTALAPWLLTAPRGGGSPVLVVPGFGAGDGSTAVLRRYLGLLGHDVSGWGLGRNRGNVPKLIPAVMELVASIAADAASRVHVVGWSLGGYLVREAARELPDAVDRVVTYGSPVVGGPKFTATAAAYRRAGYDLDEIEAEVARRAERPIRRPITAIFTRSDRVVDWRACIDHTSPDVEHVEVATTHLGLGFCPEVYRIVAARLASDV
jgi:pimeloyl-ACP methyl ester carboxylesterase